MDSGDNFDSEKKIADPSGFQSSIPSSDWRYVGTNTTLPVTNPVASCNGDLIDPPPSAPESHFTIPWGSPNNPQPLCFCNIDLQTNASISNTATAAVIRSRFSLPDASGIASQSFHADSAIVERAAGFSCFNGFGFSNTVNQLGCQTIPNFMGGGTMQGSPRSFVADALKNVAGGLCKNNELKTSETRWCVENAGVEGRPLMNARKIADIARVNEEGDAEFSNSGDREDASILDGPVGESSMASKKRKRGSQADELNQAKGVPSQTTEPANCGGQNPASISNKCVGKQASGPPKQEYIHVRARRGQATNSHSLAERVRREKISERMKLLQDLLPGCCKVTGKAVMLDEIINYVQSLQRQVELLSMKLAAVNPQMDLSGDRHDAKDIIQPQVDLSLLGFSQDVAMNYAQSHPAQPRSIQSGPPDMGNPFDALQRTTTFDWRAMNGNFREPSQLLNSWDDELYNVFQMSFEAIAPSNSQDVKACLPLSQMKFEWQPT